MTVRELIALLSGADPDALVLLIAPHADPAESVLLEEVIVDEHPWTRETGCCEDGSYTAYYSDSSPEILLPAANVKTESVRFVLLGEELENFYLFWNGHAGR